MGLRYTPWTVEETAPPGASLRSRESVFTVGNGHLGVRGYAEEAADDGDHSIRVAGIYGPGGEGVPDLAVGPDVLALDLRIGGRRLDGGPRTYRRVLDLRRGVLTREVDQAVAGRQVRLVYERFASLADHHLVGQRLRVTAVDQAVTVTVTAALDGRRVASPARLDGLGHRGRDGVVATWSTVDGRYRAAQVARSRAALDGRGVGGTAVGSGVRLGRRYRVRLAAGQSLVVERLVATVTTREDRDPHGVARGLVAGRLRGTWDRALAAHVRAWSRWWRRVDLEIDGPVEDQAALRYALFQLVQNTPHHDVDLSVAAKGLTGPGYRGHAFWDTEAFMVPCFTALAPRTARNLLRYRYRALDAARRKAAGMGFGGAMFPWESADTGDEACVRYLPGAQGEPFRVLIGEREIHVSADIALAAWRYVQATGDDGFRHREYLALVVETARFWAERAWRDRRDGRWHLRDVIGPDELHWRVDDNAYTNVMAAWNLRAAADAVRRTRREHPGSRHLRALRLLSGESAGWRRVADGLHLPRDPSTGLWEQFAGYHALPRREQRCKQGDVLMMMTQLPETFDAAEQRVNWEHYAPRCLHTSSLSPSCHAVLACRLGLAEEAYAFFRQAAFEDLADAHGNGGKGLHCAALGGTWDAAVRGFLGLDLTCAKPKARARLPDAWRSVRMTVMHRGKRYRVEADRRRCRITS